MDCLKRADDGVYRTQFGQIMNRAVEHNERFVVDRRGEGAEDNGCAVAGAFLFLPDQLRVKESACFQQLV